LLKPSSTAPTESCPRERASVDETSEDAQHVLAEADRAMYATKKAKLAAG